MFVNINKTINIMVIDIGFQLNGRRVTIPLTLTYGCNERIDESSGRHSYDLA